MTTSAFLRVLRPLVAVGFLVGLLALAGSAGASKPGWYNYPEINTGSNTVGSVRTGGTGALECNPACTEQGPNPQYAGIYFQWLSCNGVHGGGRAAPPGGLQDEGGPCPGAAIIRPKSKAPGANSYTLQASDVGRWVQMEIIAVNYDCGETVREGPDAGKAECRYSEAHAWTGSVGPVVAAGPPPPPPPPPVPIAIGPTYTALPAITGEPADMQTLTVSNGTWNGTAPLSFAYQWLQCSKKNNGCKPIEGQTSSTYTLTSADVATRITAMVTARNTGGTFTAAAKLTPKIAGAKPRPGNDALDVAQLLPRHRLTGAERHVDAAASAAGRSLGGAGHGRRRPRLPDQGRPGEDRG